MLVLNFFGTRPAANYPSLPYLDTAYHLIIIPYCLPDDKALVERMRWNSAAEMNQVWPDMFRQTHERGELFTPDLHPERRIEECSCPQSNFAAGPCSQASRVARASK